MKTCWITLSVVAACLVAPAEGAKLKVPADYATIQAAVNAANAGDIVEVSSGTYFETVSISANDLTLRAKSGHTVTIDAGGSGEPLSIGFASDVTVQNIRLRNSADSIGLNIAFASSILIKGCTVDGVWTGGISAVLASEVVIEECVVKNTNGYGIRLDASGSVVRDTTVKNTGGDGILVTGSTNTIEENTITNTFEVGIRLGNNPTTCESCVIADNDIEDASNGIFVDTTATGNSIIENIIESIEFDGIELEDGAEDNIVSGNSIRASGDSGMECAADYCLLSRNKVKKSAADGTLIEAAGQACLFYKNKVKQSTGDGFQIDGTGNALVENLAQGSGAYDLNDNTAPGGTVYLGNTFTTIAP